MLRRRGVVTLAMVAIATCTLWLGGAFAADPPELLALQGYLATVDGTPVDGMVAMSISLYPQQSGGEALYTEPLPAVPVDHSRYSVLVGGIVPLPDGLFTASSEVWVGVRINGGPELPRTRLPSVPFSHGAGVAQTAVVADSAGQLSCSGCIDQTTIADGAVTRDHLGDALLDSFVDRAGDTMQGDLDLDSHQLMNMRFHTSVSAPVTCSPANAGFVYFNLTESKLYVCTGAKFAGLATAVADDDEDGVLDGSDNCKTLPNVGQLDTDGDGFGDVCDTDDDGDGVPDDSDGCPLVADAGQTDSDSDGLGDACDPDDDDDGWPDTVDCQATNAAVHPNAPELCNGADDDCDGTPDDGC